jgi:hypothetical protein
MLVVAAVSASGLAQEKKAFTDAAEAGPDFQKQGEYVGEATIKGQKTKLGIQVIGQADGKHKPVVHLGGLPGEGSTGKEGKSLAEALGEAAEAEFRVQQGVLAVRNSGGQELFTAKKVERKSPTLGAKPPQGAVVLFDGSTAEHFNGGKITEDKLLMVGVTSKQAFGDCTLHMEFRTPYMPAASGQGRGNSGLYIQDRYECQILDSFGLQGKNNECGGFYTQREPDTNMCLPPLTWQTYDIDFTAAKFDATGTKTKNALVTVRHNGVVIHKDFELPGSTPGGKPESATPGPIQLQNHGNPVHFRNIWIVERK